MANSCVSNCIVCFCTFKSERCKNPEYFTSVFDAFCRLLEINLIEERMRWDFEKDDNPFCDYCYCVVAKLKGFYDELDAIQQKLNNILQTTQRNIQKSLRVTNNNMANKLSEPLDRVNYIRQQVMKRKEKGTQMSCCNQVFQNSVNSKEVIEALQVDTDLILKVEIKEEEKNGNSSSFIDRTNEEYGFQNQIDLNDPLDGANNDSCIETPSIIDNDLTSEDVKGSSDAIFIPSEANNKIIVETSCIASVMINTDPEKSSKCRYWEKPCRRKCSLKPHLKRHLVEEDEQQQEFANCEKIVEAADSVELLQTNIKNTEIFKYICDFCYNGYHSIVDLQRHVRIHSRDAPYKCEVCHKSYHKSRYLKQHQIIHTGIKPFKCDLCGKCFSYSHVLKDHQSVHTGDKPYKCGTCDKYFSQNRSLVNHMRLHTGEKPYKCNACGNCFSRSGDLLYHRRKYCWNTVQI